jgi:hypothetical protein
MSAALLIGLGVVTVVFAAGRLLSTRAPGFAHTCRFGAHALIRILAAVALGLAIAHLLGHPSPLRVAAAAVLCVLALWCVLSAGLATYVSVSPGRGGI